MLWATLLWMREKHACVPGEIMNAVVCVRLNVLSSKH